MSIPQERCSDLFSKLSNKDKEQAIDFMEFLYEKRKKAWKEALGNVPEEDEELSPEEIQALKESEEDIAVGRTMPLDKFLQELEL